MGILNPNWVPNMEYVNIKIEQIVWLRVAITALDSDTWS